jgi:ribonuclease VapC
LDESIGLFTSPVAAFETVATVSRKSRLDVETVTEQVKAFLQRAGIETRPVTRDVGEFALVAFVRYGKGQGHPAQLNLGDCFAYAMAKAHGARLLYKGDDFARTDLA